MEARRRRIAVAGTALAALGLAAGGVTYAATSGGGPQQESNALAEAINAREGTHLTGDDIQAALTDVLKERLDAAVKAGKLTQDEADRMLERAKDGGVPLGPGFGERHMMFRGGPFGDAAAKALGISEDALRDQLEAGKSLADVAKARNVPVDTVVAAIRDEILDNPPPGATAPTSAQATQMAQRIVNASPGKGRFHVGGPPPPGAPPGP